MHTKQICGILTFILLIVTALSLCMLIYNFHYLVIILKFLSRKKYYN